MQDTDAKESKQQAEWATAYTVQLSMETQSVRY